MSLDRRAKNLTAQCSGVARNNQVDDLRYSQSGGEGHFVVLEGGDLAYHHQEEERRRYPGPAQLTASRSSVLASSR